MSFGFSVGDFLAVGQLAWKVYKACKEAPESFGNISNEVLSLHAVLKETEEIMLDQTLPPPTQQSLATVTHGCECVLKDLQALIQKYESLGSRSKLTFDRLKWGSNDISELRARLTSNTVLLNTFISTSQIVVEKKLRKLMKEFQDGKREGSVLTVATVDSLARDEKEAWRAIRKEFESIGISVAAFDANKTFIMSWFQQAIEHGAFEEQGGETRPNLTEDDAASISDSLNPTADTRFTKEDVNESGFISATPGNNTGSASPTISQELEMDRLRVTEPESEYEHGGMESLPQTTNSGSSFDWQFPSSTAIISRKRPPKVLGLVTWLLRYNKAFYDACATREFVQARKLLEKGADINARQKYFTPLTLAAANGNLQACYWLLDNGADVEVRDSSGATPLHRTIDSSGDNSKTDIWEVIELLIRRSADVNAKIGSETSIYKACQQGRSDILHLLLDSGAKYRPTTSEIHFSPLEVTVRRGSSGVLQVLLSRLGGVDFWGAGQLNIALAFAVRRDKKTDIDMVRLLLDHGADINYEYTPQPPGIASPLVYAMLHRNDALAHFLIKRNADIISPTRLEMPMIHLAAKCGCSRAIEALLARGVDIDTKDTDGRTPLEVVISRGDEKMAQFLIDHGAQKRA